MNYFHNSAAYMRFVLNFTAWSLGELSLWVIGFL